MMIHNGFGAAIFLWFVVSVLTVAGLVLLHKKHFKNSSALFKSGLVCVVGLINIALLVFFSESYIAGQLEKGSDAQVMTLADAVIPRMTSPLMGRHLLFYAFIAERNDKVIEYLIKKDPQSVNRVDPVTKVTPLYLATSMGRVEAVDLLVKANADVNITNTQRGTTPLMSVLFNREIAQKTRDQIVRILLKAGARQDLQSTSGRTALHYATVAYCLDGYGITLEMLENLLKSGADVDRGYEETYKRRTTFSSPYTFAKDHCDNAELVRLFEQYRKNEKASE